MDLEPFIFLHFPNTLRPLANFVGEIKKSLRGIVESRQNLSVSNSYFKVTIYAINHAFQMLDVIGFDLQDREITEFIEKLNELRELLLDDFGDDGTIKLHPIPNGSSYNFDPNEILFAEADELFQFAKQQLDEGFRIDASRNFHYASIFYRVIENMFPSVRQKMLYSAQLHRQTSPLSHNFVPEYLTGAICADNYEVHGSSKIGKGSYGSVYRATHKITGDERAVKVLNVDTITSYYLKKLHTELIILKEVDHPNIVRLQEVYFGKRSVYMVTDLCRGGELYEYLTALRQKGHLVPEARISSLMKDILASLKYLHSKNIVHRDLKLENFLFRDRSPDSDLILIDFGLSKHFDPTERINQRVGSCYYTAPEVLNTNYDQRCDVWSAGVICYMLMTGSPPFTGAGPDLIHQSILTKTPDYGEKRMRHISPQGIDFVQRLLVKSPSERMTLTEALAHPFISPPITLPVTPSQPAPPPRSKFTFSLKKLTSRHKHNSTSPLPPPTLVLFEQSTLAAIPQIIEGLKIYSSLNVVIRMFLKCIAHSVSDVQHATCRVLFHDLDVHTKGFLTAHDLMAAVETQAKREEIETLFLTIPLYFSGDHHGHSHHFPSQQQQQQPSLSKNLSSSSLSNLPGELPQTKRSFSEPVPDSLTHLPPANPSLSSSQSSTKLSAIFKFLSPNTSKTSPPPPTLQSSTSTSSTSFIERSHSNDDRMSGSGSSTAGLDREEVYDKEHILTYNDFIASFLCRNLSDQLDRAMVVFKYLDLNRNDTVTVNSIITQFGQDIPEDVLNLAFKDLLESVYRSVISENGPLQMSSMIFRQAWIESIHHRSNSLSSY